MNPANAAAQRWLAPLLGPRIPRWVMALLLVVIVAAGVSYLHRIGKGRSALLRWLPQVEELVEGKNVFLDEEQGGYTFPHPPFAAAQLIPYTFLPRTLAAVLFFLAKWAAFLLSLWLIARAVAEDGRPFCVLSLIAVFLLSLRTAMSDIQHGNINLFILFWCVLAFWCWRFRRPGLAGLALAVGISLKVTPALALVYFAWKRAWRACAAAALGLVLFNVAVPALVFGPGPALEYSVSWYRGMVEPHIVRGEVDRNEMNQSLQGVAMRCLTRTRIEPTDDDRVFPPLLDLSLSTAKRVKQGLLLAWVLLLGWLLRLRAEGAGPFLLAAEYSLVLLSMLYLNERSWKHMYVLVAMPYAAWVYLLQRAVESGAPRSVTWRWGGWLLGSIALVLISAPGVIGEAGADFFEWYGAMFFSSLILFAGLAILVRRARARGWSSLGDLFPHEAPAIHASHG